MLPELAICACLTAGAVLRRRRQRRQRRSRTPVNELPDSPNTNDLNSQYRELQQLLEVAIGHPRLLLTSRWQSQVQMISRRITQSNGVVPWQLMFVYRQMETIVDTLSYDELYELFGGHPTPPAITKDEVRVLETSEYDETRCERVPAKDEPRSDRVSCPICLQDYAKGDKLMVLPTCNHVYHSKCIIKWLRLRGDCPICRCQVKEHIRAATSLKSVHLHSHC